MGKAWTIVVCTYMNNGFPSLVILNFVILYMNLHFLLIKTKGHVVFSFLQLFHNSVLMIAHI